MSLISQEKCSNMEKFPYSKQGLVCLEFVFFLFFVWIRYFSIVMHPLAKYHLKQKMDQELTVLCLLGAEASSDQ